MNLKDLTKNIKITKNDLLRYNPYLQSWPKLSRYLNATNPDNDVLFTLFMMEIKGAMREEIIYRLTSRLCSNIREEFHKQATDIYEDELHERENSRKAPKGRDKKA